ncbi:MAG TPA: hypothetical protein VFZ24_01730 [Longimicrobiales bacterium]
MTGAMTQMLRLQWLASRWLLLVLALICIGLPQAVVRLAVLGAHGADRNLIPAALLQSLDSISVLFPYLAAITGALIALAAWNWDHRTGHVYALSLPISRAEYALLKLWAGAVALLVPTVAIWIGAWIATSTVPIPDGLHAYPFAFGVRFLLAGTIVYGTMFALASGTIRTTLIVTIGWCALFIGGSLLVPWLESQYAIELLSPTEMLGHAFAEWPGPFRVFAGSWLLIDV